ncbi:putative metalloendopeptidase [Erythromicrobium ramosum]|uniref:Metalloendopeptidase n=1 Tax=Erythrobacter ramosus TaxID=35811 RepID=A0A6I4UFB9_9SPHN|nr:M13 family metallopeptidase [Erythrobacter ramosus]MBB3775238.1 putative metalloendopeptidase [Erythrobacter ramosus]MXP37138.1 hypothetical protein [Erythrobacter ramosus]
MKTTATFAAMGPVAALLLVPILATDASSRTLALANAPGDDFYLYANAEWIAAARIPEGATGISRKSQLAQQVDAAVLSAIRDGRNLDKPVGTPEHALGSAYAAFMDTALIERKGLQPIAASLAWIDGVQSQDALAGALGRAYVENSASPFTFRVYPDPVDPRRAALHFIQSGLGRGSRESYESDATPAGAVRRDSYIAYLEKLIAIVDPADAASRARAVYGLEARLAASFATFSEMQDITRINNPIGMNDLATSYPGMNWPRYFKDAGLPQVDHVIVAHPGAVKGTIEQMGTTPLAVWRDYLRVRLLDQSAEWLPTAVRDARFAYVGRVLQGRSQPRPRGELAVSMLQSTVPELVGQVYVGQVASPDTKEAALRLVSQIRGAFRARLEKVEWMDIATRKEAIAKLDALDVKVGWPDRWTDYGDQSLKPDDLVGNMRRIREAVLLARIKELKTGRDTARWRLPVTDVQAAYDPVANELTIAAGILQPPFFDPKADPAANFGAIGGIIGHELSHGFDSTGRLTDAFGKRRDWWSPASASAFKARADRVVAEYTSYPQPDGLKINGATTLDENIADIGGLSIAFAAYQRAVPAPKRIDGLTGAQRFYLAWARMRVMKQTFEGLKDQLESDPHAPADARVNVVVRQQDGWYRAFAVTPTARLYRTPSQRVRLW